MLADPEIRLGLGRVVKKLEAIRRRGDARRELMSRRMRSMTDRSALTSFIAFAECRKVAFEPGQVLGEGGNVSFQLPHISGQAAHCFENSLLLVPNVLKQATS